jgi:hypothetical protein
LTPTPPHETIATSKRETKEGSEMEYYRVRIKHEDGYISVHDMTHSQICDATSEISREQWKVFISGEKSIDTKEGLNIKLVKYTG